VVFLHGLSSNHTTWHRIIDKIHAAGFNSLTLDMRGHGHSDKTKKISHYKISVFADDLRQILDHEGVGKIVLVGYSFGGTVAIEFALKFQERIQSLILISTNFVSPLKYWGLWFARRPLALFINFLGWLLIWQKRKNYLYYQQGASRGYWHSIWIGLNTMPLSINAWMLVTAGSQDYRGHIEQILVPTLIMRAKNDPYLTQEEALDMKQSLKNSKIIISNNPKHFLPAYAQEEISHIIINFLKEVL
jgi:pimeloyl-ACP methyl ester carboxylesterase